MSAPEKSPRAVGRPRDETVGPLIRRVARELVVARGYEGVTTESIARAAGVSKQTIYRRWRTKADLVLDAFLEHARVMVDERGARKSAPVEQELAGFLQRTVVALQETGPAIRSLMAWAQQDPEFLRSFKERFIEPRRAAMRGILSRAAGERRHDGERAVEAAVIALYGAVWYRLLLDEPFSPHFGADLARVILGGLRSARADR